jgi:hypothetical protein
MDVVRLVGDSLSVDAREDFERLLDDQAAFLVDAIGDGKLDNDGSTLGLEIEVYAVHEAGDDGRRGALAVLPEGVFEETQAGKELGLHNAELNTDPSPFDEAGLAQQRAEIERRLAEAREWMAGTDLELVLDAMWTVPPANGSMAYLTDVGTDDDLVFARNMRSDPRYYAIDNDAVRQASGTVTLDVPGAHQEFPSILFESLATSIQPHLLIPTAAEVPAYFNAAIRTMGPLLALTTNSPFLPADMYGDDVDPESLLANTHHELRIDVFEQSVNQTANRKVRVPRDVDSAEDVVERVVADDLYAPFLREWIADHDRETFHDEIWEYRHKRGTYWRWLRAVIGGDAVPETCDECSIRLEYRPLPTQPTIRDTVSLLAVTAGLVHGLVVTDHPITTLPWNDARESFYDVAANGLDADLAWVTADGTRTANADRIFADVFDVTRLGLADRGLGEDAIERQVAPIERRWSERTTPSQWKIDRVRESLQAGQSLADAIVAMQQDYVDLQGEYETFVEWL